LNEPVRWLKSPMILGPTNPPMLAVQLMTQYPASEVVLIADHSLVLSAFLIPQSAFARPTFASLRGDFKSLTSDAFQCRSAKGNNRVTYHTLSIQMTHCKVGP
jgi:hypothetical protein